MSRTDIICIRSASELCLDICVGIGIGWFSFLFYSFSGYYDWIMMRRNYDCDSWMIIFLSSSSTCWIILLLPNFYSGWISVAECTLWLLFSIFFVYQSSIAICNAIDVQCLFVVCCLLCRFEVLVDVVIFIETLTLGLVGCCSPFSFLFLFPSSLHFVVFTHKPF